MSRRSRVLAGGKAGFPISRTPGAGAAQGESRAGAADGVPRRPAGRAGRVRLLPAHLLGAAGPCPPRVRAFPSAVLGPASRSPGRFPARD